MTISIEKKFKNTYRLTVSAGKNLDGSRTKKTKTIHGTRKDAEIALAKFITRINHRLVPEGKHITFEEYYHLWMQKYAEKNLAPATCKHYKGYNNYFKILCSSVSC